MVGREGREGIDKKGAMRRRRDIIDGVIREGWDGKGGMGWEGRGVMGKEGKGRKGIGMEGWEGGDGCDGWEGRNRKRGI